MRATYPDNAPKMGLWVLVWLGLATRSNESAGVEDSGGPGWHGCGARGRWRGLAGQRVDALSEARSVDGSRAGRRPRRSPELRPETWTRLMVAVMRLVGGPDLGILPGSGP